MSNASNARLFVTGATGQLGRLVVAALLRRVPASQVVAGVRDPDAPGARALQATGVAIRIADYARPATLAAAFAGIDRLLLISSSEVGQRVAQHGAVIEAAKGAGIGLLAYTSVLRADTSALSLADEHRATEAALAASGLNVALLRNGWYTENYTASIPPALAHGVLLGSAGIGRIASAARADYAEAAAAVLTAREAPAGRVYELAGDSAYTLAEFAEAVARASGKPVRYQDLPPAAFRSALLDAGLPDALAGLLAESDAAAAKGALFDESRTLSDLIGRPTTPLARVIEDALRSPA